MDYLLDFSILFLVCKNNIYVRASNGVIDQ
jgi:hypothetical protein